jgi:diguanylate cyclase (GGDEF)-like protein/PAS domain S-box-containing protein
MSLATEPDGSYDFDGEPQSFGASNEIAYQRAACGLLSVDTHDVIVSVNDTFVAWIGYPRAQLLGLTFRQLLAPGSRIFYETRYQPVLRLNGEAREVALSLTRSDHTVLAILVNSREWSDEPGLIRMAVFDSTRRHDYEFELLKARRAAEASEQRVRSLQDASSAFANAQTETALAWALVASAREAFAAAEAAVVLVDAAGQPYIAAGEHLRSPLLRLRALNSGYLHNFLTVSVGDPGHPLAGRILKTIRMESLSIVPLTGEHGTLGALVLFYGRAREFDESATELHEALARQASQMFDRLRLQAELQTLAMHDQLTGLANRTLLHERLAHAIAVSHRSHRPMALIFADLDGFKAVNDSLGHRMGDIVLQTVAERITSVVRETDTVGRLGGDEFLIICEDADERAVMRVAERVLACVNQPFSENIERHNIAVSIGIASYRPSPLAIHDNESLVHAADAAMYRSKQAGGARVTLTVV